MVRQLGRTVPAMTPLAAVTSAPGRSGLGTPRQYAVLLGGAVLLALGVALTLLADLGVGSWQVFETGIMAATGATFAVVAVVESLLVLVVAWAWLAQRPGPATVLFALAVGPLVGWLLDVVPGVTTAVPAGPQLVVGMVLIGIGVGFYVGAGLGASAQDSLFVGLITRFRLRPRDARLLTDGALVVAGWLLGGQVGVGTVLLTIGLPLVVEPGMRAGARLAGQPVEARSRT